MKCKHAKSQKETGKRKSNSVIVTIAEQEKSMRLKKLGKKKQGEKLANKGTVGMNGNFFLFYCLSQKLLDLEIQTLAVLVEYSPIKTLKGNIISPTIT